MSEEITEIKRRIPHAERSFSDLEISFWGLGNSYSFQSIDSYWLSIGWFKFCAGKCVADWGVAAQSAAQLLIF